MIAVIGDIHGYYDLLVKLHQKILTQYSDIKIYCVGDLIDRGPDSKKVVQYCIDNHFIVIKGNHELMLEDFLNTYNIWKKSLEINLQHFIHGGKQCMASYIGEFSYNRFGEYFVELKNLGHIDFIKNMPWHLNVGKYNISHAGYYSNLPPETASFMQQEPNKHSLFQIFGHQPHDNVIITDYYCNVDVGSFLNKKLAAVIVDENKEFHEFHQIIISN